MTDVVDSPSYSSVKSPPVVNSQPSSPNKPAQSVVAPERLEQNVFTIAKLLDTSSSGSQSLSVSETSTLIAMREKIDERLRHSEAGADTRMIPHNPMPLAFMSQQFHLWNILHMMNSGGIGTTPKIEQAEAERVLAQSFQFQQQNIQDVQRNPPHHSLAGVSGNSSNNSDLSRISRESSNAGSPAASNASDGEQNEEEFGLNPSGGIRKKKTRTVFSRQQVTRLETAFNVHRYLNSNQRSQLAIDLGLTETQVKIWFQNRRNKWKRQANGEELNTSSTRPSSTGPLAASLPTTTNSAFGTDAFRMFLSQSSQFNPAQFIGTTAMTLPQLPQMFSLGAAIKGGDSIMNTTPGSLDLARLFAANFLNGPVVENPEANSNTNSKKSSMSTSNGTPSRLQE